jgi:hypothetical protein
MKRMLPIWVLLAALCVPAAAQPPAGTAFSYQGRLADAGTPANGPYDFEFRLFDAPAGGTQVGPAVAKNDVTVTAGLFTTGLDFGPASFVGFARWLQVAVRPGASTGPYTVIGRQELQPTPNAMFSATAPWSGLTLMPAGFADGIDNDSGGDITGVSAGTGLTGGAPSGNATLAVDFTGSSGTASTAARVDHQHLSQTWNATGGTGLTINNTGTAFSGESSVSTGVFGQSTSAAGVTNGVWGRNLSTNGRGVFGQAFAASGTNYGVYGTAASPDGTGVYGGHLATSGDEAGVTGETDSTSANAAAVIGRVTPTAPGANSAAVRAVNNGTGPLGIGVWGSHAGAGWGVNGTTASGIGVRGLSSAASGATYGVQGIAGSPDGAGVYGRSLATTGTAAGVIGETDGTSNPGTGVLGRVTSTATGGQNTAGVHGINNHVGAGYGVLGTHLGLGIGVSGTSVDGIGVSGASNGDLVAIGVFGSSTSITGTGVKGTASSNSPDAIGVYGESGAFGYAGYFFGRVQVTGTLSKGGGSFKIDHPVDPAHKYLYHSFVESPDMMNIYNGNVTTDAAGYATVELPAWFEALNRDFRYQLSVLDEGDGAAFVQAKVVRKVAGNRFTIRTSAPRTEVSWQVTGIRKDAFAEKYRIPVEEEKTGAERGRYLHPEAHGRPAEDGIGYQRRLRGAERQP